MGKQLEKNHRDRELTRKITEGIFSYSVDLLLWMTVYFGKLMISEKPYKAFFSADRFVEEFNYETLKNALASARKKGLLKKGQRGKRINPEITMEGKKRLEAILPHYDIKRVWDSRIYLVTYDIAEAKRFDRDLLREYLERLGGAKLQDSVWLIPYNPKDSLKKFIREKNLSGSIIISDIGEDGSIGEEDLKDLIVRVYKLIEINQRYEEFISEVKNEQKEKKSVADLFKFLAILRDDPQLPFQLLPGWWKGDEAYLLVKEFLN